MKIKLIPLVLAIAAGVGIAHHFFAGSDLAAIAVGVPLYVLLFCITWRRTDGSHVFPNWLW